jgi:energy-coupling factor transporter ATP-binding protein EcfA2
MQLISVRVRRFRNILDSSEVSIDPAVTCLVGKNESGKTAFLHALYRLNPARSNVRFSVPDQYPAWQEKRDRLRGERLEDVRPVTAVFALDSTDQQVIDEKFGVDTLANAERVSVSRNYEGTLLWEFEFAEPSFVAHIVDIVDWPQGTKPDANKLRSIEELQAYAARLKSEATDGDGGAEAVQMVTKQLSERLTGGDLRSAITNTLTTRIPQFLYFSEYSTLPYSVPIRKLLTSNQSELDDDELTARSLLKLAAAEDEYLINPDYERRKRELENVANALTQDVLKYWSQNPDLRVQPDITLTTVPDYDYRGGTQSVVDELKIRIWDQRHQLSLPFNEHSTGFRWFFSFLAAFSEYEYRSEPIIILLDEPALGLHARAQADFLQFINERLTTSRQVLYTTHSPFMVEPGRLERVRLVEDKGQTEGTKITADVSTTDPDTLFPLQGALGYDLAQHLFIGAHNLVVEGTSDYTYLRVISDYFASEGTRAPLDERWSLIPVGGVDLVPTFAALLGNHLDLTVLIDAQKGGHQRLSRLSDQGILSAKRIITVGAVLGRTEADIEDLFEDAEYLMIFNRAFGASVTEAQLKGMDPIVRRIARVIGKDRFDHGQPADIFLRHRDDLLPRLSTPTLDRFERLFLTLNATLV